MKYAHIDSNNFILGWYTPELHSNIPTPNVEVSDSTWKTALNNSHNHITAEGVTSFVDPKTTEELAAEVRAERNYYLKHEVDPIVTNPLRWEGLTLEKQQEWKDYRTALLTLPDQSSFPNTVTWPNKPASFSSNF
jgi:hypothetical protein